MLSRPPGRSGGEAASARIHRLPIPTWGRRTTWGRLVPFAGYALGAAALTPFVRDVDVVYALSTPPFLSAIIAAALTKLGDVPFVYNLQDVYPDVALALGVIRPGVLASASRQVERFLRRRAAAVVVVGRDMRALVEADDDALDNVHVIPNWIDTDAVKPVPRSRNGFRHEHGLDGAFVVLYSGNLGRVHGAEMLPAIAAELADLPDLRLVIVGDGPAKAEVLADVERRGLENVVVLPYQPKERLAASLSAADVSLVFQREETLGMVVPSKLYGILASGRPVVAAGPADSEVAAVLEETGAGVTVRAGDWAAVARSVRELYLHKATARKMGKQGRRAAVASFDRRVATKRYLDLFAAVAGQSA